MSNLESYYCEDILIKEMYDDLHSKGDERLVEGKLVKEIINYDYAFNSKMVCVTTPDEKKYIKEKIESLHNSLFKALDKLNRSSTTRQALVQFSQDMFLPNCTVVIQVQIREKRLYLNVFARSQDIDKVQMDCEIYKLIATHFTRVFTSVEEFLVYVTVGNFHTYL